MTLKLFPGIVLSLIAMIVFISSENSERMEGTETADTVPDWRRSAEAAFVSPVVREAGNTRFAAPEAVRFRASELSFAKAFPAMQIVSSAASVERFILSLDLEPGQPSESPAKPAPAHESAFASLNPGTAGATEIASAIDSGGGAAYPELPPKGIAVRASGTRFREEQQQREAGLNVYNHSGTRYSLAFEYDWSIDSIVGASVEILDSTLKSLHDADSRENRIEGYFANVLYKGNLFGVYPVEAKGFYGWMDHEGSGRVAPPGLGFSNPWKEDAHHSTAYGFSAKAGVPLLFLNSLKIMPEAGIRYTKLTTKGYSVDTSDFTPMPIRIPQVTSTSIAVPVGVTAKMDFPKVWGIVTPRVGAGLEMEFDKSATGVRVMHSAAASRIGLDAMSQLDPNSITFDPAHRLMTNFNLGLEVKTVGGWELSAEYMRKWVASYTRDDFKLEIGRCF